jgi:hypothetical protein
MPVGPTQFVRAPWIDEVERLDASMVMLRARAAVAPGREWLADGFLTQVLQESAPDGLIIHGPVVMETDELARRRFARASLGGERGSAARS